MTNQMDHNIDNRRVYPVTLVWGLFREDRKVPVILNHKVEVIEAFTMFAQFKATEYLKKHAPTDDNKGSYNSHILPIGYNLKAFTQYLRSKQLMWQDVGDAQLEEFKLTQHNLVRMKSNSLTNETIKETVNIKLRTIYEFYWWAQHEQLFIQERIGNDISSPIRSNIAQYKKDPINYRKDKAAMKMVYPLCESVTAAVGKHRRQHYSSEDEFDNIRKHFRNCHNTLVGERNVLIVDIINHIGWRDGSVASLTAAQFSDEIIKEALKNHDKIIKVTPDHQKRGYGNKFDVEVQLTIRINKFIRDNRQVMLDNIKKADTNIDKGRLFISEITGRPLTAQTISRIISDAFKSIGVNAERVGGHSIRRKYGSDKSSEIVDTRKRKGISTDPHDVAMDLAALLGQSTLAAQDAYNEYKRGIYTGSIESKQRGQIAELESEVSSYRLEAHRMTSRITQLEKQLAEFMN